MSSAMATPLDVWVQKAAGAISSPAVAQSGDTTGRWNDPSGQGVSLTVKIPHPAANASTVTLPAVPAGADARPYFEAALAQVRAQKAGKLLIPKATYVFKTLGFNSIYGNAGHLVISGLTDVTIDGQGSTFQFTQNANGIFVTASQRTQLRDINIEYTLNMTSLATMQVRGGQNVLVVDSKYPTIAADTVGNIAEYDRTAQKFVVGGSRVYFPPGSSNMPVLSGAQTYSSTGFQGTSLAGKSFVVFHHWYGGTAVQVEDTPGATQSEDITIGGVSIYSGPGMGIVAYGIKRGFGVWSSQITAKPGSLASTEYDAIHVTVTGGDVAILNNLISNQGDDGINLDNPVFPVVSVASPKVTLSTYSRFIMPGDTLAFFDANDTYLGTASVVGTPVSTGGTNNQNHLVTLNGTVANMSTAVVARDLSLIDSRASVMGNTIRDCGCHGILVQTPNTIVSNNVFSNTMENAIRLLTNIGNFVEGVGAINVVVSQNVLSNIGSDAGINGMTWAAISAYGVDATASVSASPVNKYINIVSNQITNAQQGCITIASTDTVTLSKNTCTSTNMTHAKTPSINIINSTNVTMQSDNTRSGASTGGILVTPAASTVHSQANY